MNDLHNRRKATRLPSELFVERAVVRWVGDSQLGVEIVAMAPVAHMRLAGLMAAIPRERGCVCTPLLPWHCRGPYVLSAANRARGAGRSSRRPIAETRERR